MFAASRDETGTRLVEVADWIEPPADPGRLAAALRALRRRLGRERVDVLLVGHSSAVASVHKAMLSPIADCRVYEDGAEAVESAQAQAPDALVIDPGGSGDALRDLVGLAQRAQVAVVVVSNHTGHGVFLDAMTRVEGSAHDVATERLAAAAAAPR